MTIIVGEIEIRIVIRNKNVDLSDIQHNNRQASRTTQTINKRQNAIDLSHLVNWHETATANTSSNDALDLISNF